MKFNGRENFVKVERRFYKDFSCLFKLQYYPFDTQVKWNIQLFSYECIKKSTKRNLYFLQQVCSILVSIFGKNASQARFIGDEQYEEFDYAKIVGKCFTCTM